MLKCRRHTGSNISLRSLLDAVIPNDHPCSSIDPDTYRTLLLVLYGAALRVGEALALTMADVDVATGILLIRETKFYKYAVCLTIDDLCESGPIYREENKPQSA
jgi:integrase/recombinase XerD